MDRGHEVVGVRRSADGIATLRDAGLGTARADLTDVDALRGLPDADCVLFMASPGRRGDQTARMVYIDALRAVIDEYANRDDPPDRLCYTSSTGVYGDHGGDWVDESTDPNPAGQRGSLLLEAEATALESEQAGIDTTVIRFGGLYGPSRYAMDRYLTGPVTAGFRNATHQRDAAGAIDHLLSADAARGEVVLVVDNEPVDRWAFAEWLASECGEPDPPMVTVEERLADPSLSDVARERVKSDKRCRNDRLRDLGYEPEVPTVWAGYRSAIEAYES